MIEEHTTIDTIARTKDGRIELVIMDHGETTDAEARFAHLIEKLKSYLYYVLEGDFKNDFPDKRIQDVAIRVMCRIPPTDEMARLTRLSSPSDPSEGIDIIYQYLPDGGDAVVRSAATVSSASTQRSRLVFYVMLALGVLTCAAAVIGYFRTGRSPVAGIGIGIFFMALGYVSSLGKRA